MKKKKENSLFEKIGIINLSWDRCEVYIAHMPDREMFEINEDNADMFDDIYLDDNASWMLWELEMME